MTCECDGRGWVVEPDGGAGRARRCACFTARPIEQRLREAGVGADLLHASWVTWKGVRPNLGTFPAPAVSLTLIGWPGTGKSHVAVAILREWLNDGHRGRFIDVPDFLEELKGRFGEAGDVQQQLVREALSPDLLVLDEAYTNQRSDWADALVSRLIRARLREQKALIVTTNLTREQLAAIEPRIASRLEGNHVEALLGRDRRKERVSA